MNPYSRNVFAALLAVVLATTIISARAADVCTFALHSERAMANETLEEFQRRKEFWRGVDPKTNQVQPTTPYDILAFAEVAGERGGFDILRISEILQAGTASQRARLGKIARKFDDPDRWTRRSLANFVTELYLISNPLLKIPTVGFIPTTFERAVLRRLDMQLATEDVEVAFREFGLLRNPKLFGRFKQWKADHAVLYDSIDVAVQNAFFITLVGVPGGMPDPHFMKLTKIADDIKARYKSSKPYRLKELAPEVEAAIRKDFRITGRADVAVSTARLVYSSLIVGAFIAFIADEETRQRFEDLMKLVKLANTTDADLKKYQEENFDCETQRKRMWESFNEGFHDLYERYPDPKKYPDDRTLYESSYDRIMRAPCDSLKVTFE